MSYGDTGVSDRGLELLNAGCCLLFACYDCSRNIDSTRQGSRGSWLVSWGIGSGWVTGGSGGGRIRYSRFRVGMPNRTECVVDELPAQQRSRLHFLHTQEWAVLVLYQPFTRTIIGIRR